MERFLKDLPNFEPAELADDYIELYAEEYDIDTAIVKTLLNREYEYRKQKLESQLSSFEMQRAKNRLDALRDRSRENIRHATKVAQKAMAEVKSIQKEKDAMEKELGLLRDDITWYKRSRQSSNGGDPITQTLSTLSAEERKKVRAAVYKSLHPDKVPAGEDIQRPLNQFFVAIRSCFEDL